jgi:hypothetical protein
MVRIEHHEYLTEEEKRLKEDRERTKYWKKWGPYVAERQWATGKNTLSRVCADCGLMLPMYSSRGLQRRRGCLEP